MTLPKVRWWRRVFGACPFFKDVSVYAIGDDAHGEYGVSCNYGEKVGTGGCPVEWKYGVCPVLVFADVEGRTPRKEELTERKINELLTPSVDPRYPGYLDDPEEGFGPIPNVHEEV